MTDKGEWLMYRAHVKGQSAQQLLAGMVSTALAKLPIPKLMRWGDSDVQFVRPVHTVTMLLGADLIPCTVLGIDSARTVRATASWAKPSSPSTTPTNTRRSCWSAAKWSPTMKRVKPLIKRDAELAAQKIGGKADLSDSLLEEVASLVEWPVVLTAKFEEKFTAVPAEALVYTMKGDQKYFRCMTPRANCCRTLSSWPTSSRKTRSRSSPVTRRWCVHARRRRVLLQHRP